MVNPRGSAVTVQIVRQSLLSFGAAGAFVCIVWVNSLFWHGAYLGFYADPETGVILELTPGGAAERVGLHVGDRILSL